MEHIHCSIYLLTSCQTAISQKHTEKDSSLSTKEVNLCILKGTKPLIAAILFGSNVLRPRALTPITLHSKVFLGNRTRTKWRAAYLGLVFCRAFTKWFPRTFTFLTGSPTNSFVKQKHKKKKLKSQTSC